MPGDPGVGVGPLILGRQFLRPDAPDVPSASVAMAPGVERRRSASASCSSRRLRTAAGTRQAGRGRAPRGPGGKRGVLLRSLELGLVRVEDRRPQPGVFLLAVQVQRLLIDAERSIPACHRAMRSAAGSNGVVSSPRTSRPTAGPASARRERTPSSLRSAGRKRPGRSSSEVRSVAARWRMPSVIGRRAASWSTASVPAAPGPRRDRWQPGRLRASGTEVPARTPAARCWQGERAGPRRAGPGILQSCPHGPGSWHRGPPTDGHLVGIFDGDVAGGQKQRLALVSDGGGLVEQAARTQAKLPGRLSASSPASITSNAR